MKRLFTAILPAFLMANAHPTHVIDERMKNTRKDKRRMPVTKLWEHSYGAVAEITDKETLLNHLILLESDDYVLARNWINARRKFDNRAKAKACTK